MKITVLLFCLFASLTIACALPKTASVNAENENVSVSERPSADENARIEKTFDSDSEPAAQGGKFTGIYEFKGGNRANEIRVLQISEGVLKVSFLGNSQFESQMGPMANSGVISARKIQLENGSRALLTNEEDAPECMIFLTFKGNRLEVKQKNDCGFPGGVSADGTYRRTSSEEPTFDFDEEPGDAAPEAIIENPAGNSRNDTASRIRFNAGENSGVVRGEISNGKDVTYLIGARAGQTMTVTVTEGAESGVLFDVRDPDDARLGGDRMYDNWSRKLAKNGDYSINLSALESETVGYKLQVTIH